MNKSHKLAIAIVATTAVGIAVWYIWRKKKQNSNEDDGNTSKTLPIVRPTPEDVKITSRSTAGHDDFSKNLFKLDDEHVNDVFERVFSEELRLGEELIQNDETLEQGAVHMSNAIMLTGESEQLLDVLRESLPCAKFVRILKYMPTAEIRAQHLLQDELEDESIAAIFS